jgi:quercetin dioxygenase-like cupin family protein
VNSIFPRGERINGSSHYNGAIWLNRFVSPADSLDCIVSLVTFEPGIRTNWHIHPGVPHWHRAAPGEEFAHLVVAPDANKGEVKWLQKLTDKEYNGLE